MGLCRGSASVGVRTSRCEFGSPIVGQAGFEDVALYWHAPDLRSTMRIVPLNQRGSIRSTLLRYDGMRFGRTKSLAARAVLHLGLFPLAVPEASVLGRRPADRQES